MSFVTGNIVRATALLLAAGVTLAGMSPAYAGCLREYGDCGDCARAAMIDAIRDRSVGDAMDAYVDAIDCDIDLMHCVVYGQHHSYSCAQ